MSNERGYTIAELLTAMAVLGMLMAGLFVVFKEGQDAYVFGAGRVEVQQNARVGLDRMLRELRTATQVATANANDVQFTFLDETNTLVTVEYSLNGKNLLRNQTVPAIAGQPAILVGGVSDFAVTYYDASDVTGATAANTRAVEIQVTTELEGTSLASSSPANRTAVLRGRVTLRNG